MKLKDLLLSKKGRGTFLFRLYSRKDDAVKAIEAPRRGSKKFILSLDNDKEIYAPYLDCNISTMNYAKDATTIYVEEK